MNNLIIFIKEKYPILLLTMVLCTAAFLRFYNITERGFFYFDEAYYANEGKHLAFSIKWGLGNFSDIIKSGFDIKALRDYLQIHGGIRPASGKLGHDLLIMLGLLIFGVHDWSVLIISALFGIATVYLVFIIGRKLHNFQTGIIAASVLAVSQFHIYFSRSGFAQADSVFFMCLGFYFYLNSIKSSSRRWIWLILAGLSIGFGLTCHPNLFLVPIIFAFIELFLIVKDKLYKSLKAITSSLMFAVSIALPLLLMELPYVVVKIFWADEIASWSEGRPIVSYFDEIFRRSSHFSAQAADRYLDVSALFGYLNQLWISERLLVLLLALVGVVYVLRRIYKKFSAMDLLTLLLFFVPLLFWGASGISLRLRLIVIIFPFLSLITAIGTKYLLDKIKVLKYGNLVFPFLVFLIIVVGILNNIDIIKMKVKPTYRELTKQIVEYMDKRGGVISDQQGHLYPHMKFYLADIRGKTPIYLQDSIVLDWKKAREISNEGIPVPGDFIVMVGDEFIDDNPEMEKKIAKLNLEAQEPIITLPYPVTEMSRRSIFNRISEPKTSVIRVFDLRRIKYEH